MVHRPVSPVWQETLSSWSAVTLVCRGQVRECVNTLITEPGNGFFAPLCSRNMSSVCGRELLRLIECLINGFPSLLVPLNTYPTAFWKYIYIAKQNCFSEWLWLRSILRTVQLVIGTIWQWPCACCRNACTIIPGWKIRWDNEISDIWIYVTPLTNSITISYNLTPIITNTGSTEGKVKLKVIVKVKDILSQAQKQK